MLHVSVVTRRCLLGPARAFRGLLYTERNRLTEEIIEAIRVSKELVGSGVNPGARG
jgi:hypothetical protein